MKSSKKIELLQKDIRNAMNAINEINIERISENKTPSSGMVVFSFQTVEEIGLFGDMKDFKNILTFSIFLCLSSPVADYS